MACPLLLPCSGVARGWTPRGSSSLVCSQNCLDVRAHDLVYPAYAGELHQLVHTKVRSTLVQFEGFDRHIHSNLISEFETVCNSLGGRVDPDSDGLTKPLLSGGGRGIRTPGALRLNGFQDRRDRPLC